MLGSREGRRRRTRFTHGFHFGCHRFSADFSCLFGNVDAFLRHFKEGIRSRQLMREVGPAEAPFPVPARRSWAERAPQADRAPAPPSPAERPQVLCESRCKKTDQHVRPDASLPARGENRENEKVEENFVREFQEYW